MVNYHIKIYVNDAYKNRLRFVNLQYQALSDNLVFNKLRYIMVGSSVYN